MSHDQIGLLLLIHRLYNRSALGRQTLVPFAEIKLPQVARAYDSLILELFAQKLIEGNAESFQLTIEGLVQVQTIAHQYSLHAWFYNEYYQAVLHSRAHSIFCEQVYGKDLCQHGMTDMAQIDTLIDDLGIRAGMTLLDFGCGDGRIAEAMAARTQTHVTGIDIADQAIALARTRTHTQRDRLCFLCVNVEKQPHEFPAEHFDRLIALDSIFFVQDLDAVTRLLYEHLKPSGMMGLFFHAAPGTLANQTDLARTMRRLEIPFAVRDLSVENNAHWKKKKQVLLELEPMFRAEGNDFLFKNRLAECNGLENFQRYLYVTHAR